MAHVKEAVLLAAVLRAGLGQLRGHAVDHTLRVADLSPPACSAITARKAGP
jgi:hypothetical protein